ncbi:MAG TPA: class I SAM-dependent methyltransferase [Herpetosiphonaceae bacterium]
MKPAQPAYWFPKTQATHRPPFWWYVGWVIYANRSTFAKAFALFAGTSLALFLVGLLLQLAILIWTSYALTGIGLFLLLNSLLGLTLVYGPPARRYIGQLLKLGDVDRPQRVADLHIGTYRISYLLADLLPGATIESVDIWDNTRYETERALVLLRALEAAPTSEQRIRPRQAAGAQVPLPAASCDVVVLGLGLHEIPAGAEREAIFAEAKRLLRPGGTCLFFEHTVDLQSLLVFGFEIKHWERRAQWLRLLRQTFGPNVRHQRSAQAIDLYSATRVD